METEAIPFTHAIAGSINGEHAALRIEGSVATNEVRFRATIGADERPLLWDEPLLVSAALDPVLLMSLDAGAVRRSEAPATFRVETGLYDDGEKLVGRFVLLGTWELDGEAVALRSQIVEAWMNVEPMERTRRSVMPSPLSVLELEGKLVVTHVWSLESTRGNTYTGASMSIGRILPLVPDHCDQELRVHWQADQARSQDHERRAPRAYRAVVQIGWQS